MSRAARTAPTAESPATMPTPYHAAWLAPVLTTASVRVARPQIAVLPPP